MRAQLLARATLPSLWSLDRIPGAAAWLAHGVDGSLVVLDDSLAVVREIRLPGDWKGGHSVTPDLARFVASTPDRVVVLDADGTEVWSHPHVPWQAEEAGSSAVTAAGIWAVVRTAEGDRCVLLDAADGAPRVIRPVAPATVGSELIPHPDGVHLGLAASHADDAYRIFVLASAGAEEVAEVPPGESRVLTDIHASGQMMLTTPIEAGPLSLVRFPDGAVIAARPGEQVFPDPDEVFDIYAGFLRRDLVLAASSGERHVLFSVPDLRAVAEIEYPEDAPREWLVVRSDGIWLTADAESGTVCAWTLESVG
ncbi:hypothetical protein [Embleya hyalina]|uniref:Uncharacterized protein n=1 Tax=Embleya hyalina TaxID=516124 RepID=A0A401YRL5_9ACTN|nr:hypothetical protein [Embleya hyalina]GCD97239.1 hypothetical protein EHYA_04931 [Embleya hyalina]